MVILMSKIKKFLIIICALLLTAGCGKDIKNAENAEGTKNSENSKTVENESSAATEQTEPTKTGSLELKYASQFGVDYYENGYIHISVSDGTDYIIVPENESENSLGYNNPVYIHRPCNCIYLAATSAMDLFLQLDSLGCITACSTKADDYAMEEVRDAINSGEITYVGKYSAPDYELLLGKGCGLAIESTMINHSPKIKEQLERINIPVFIERSSYEEEPLGRLEWIKLYGVLTGKEEEAQEYFDKEVEKVNKAVGAVAQEEPASRKTVAFFSITSTGSVTVRKPGDYICKMIDMAGGEYALNDLLIEEDNALSTINIGMEDFYREAHDADILIYNGTIDGGVTSLDEFLDKNDLLREFRAVKEGHVWSTSLNMFQESSKVADVIVEMSDLIGETGTQGEYLMHLE